MLIIADENIPFVRQAFAEFGEVVTVHGRKINNDLIRDAHILLVRSITKVNAELLEGSAVQFVGTATIGYDHVDVEYLASKGITFASAPGSNANSVAEYVVAGLLALEERWGYTLEGKRIGIVGVGNVGSRVLKKVVALGLLPVLNDPPLQEKLSSALFDSLDKIFECDIITFHVPLEKSGPYPTYHLVNEHFLSRVKPGTVLINTSRGAVVDTNALLEAIDKSIIRHTILDVWENEPNISIELLKKSTIATPHIAGYSFDGKVNGTYQLYVALCQFLNKKPTWDFKKELPTPYCPEIEIPQSIKNPLSFAVKQVYDIMEDDGNMRKIIEKPQNERGAYFDELRKNYPIRREFHNTVVQLNFEDESLSNRFQQLGFKMKGKSTDG